jgi:hypothetical protein
MVMVGHAATVVDFAALTQKLKSTRKHVPQKRRPLLNAVAHKVALIVIHRMVGVIIDIVV